MSAGSEALAALADTEAVPLSGVQLPPQPAPPTGAGAFPEAVPGAPEGPEEPVYDEVADDIQGHIIPGFNKDFQHFLFVRFGSADGARTWLAGLAPRISSMRDVLGFRREFRAARLARGADPDITATWVAVALSARGIAAVAGPEDVAAFGEESFRQGLAARSTYLGDPTDPSVPGHRSTWRVGGPDNEADAVVIVAADNENDLNDEVTLILQAAQPQGVSKLFGQDGRNLPAPLSGHEHFGFKDGISQPGVRGRLSAAAGDEITPRLLAFEDPHAKLFAKPGQPLVWPGQFLLGEPRQHERDPLAPAPAATNFPDWARRGSFLVCRRLNQNVTAFWEFAAIAGEALGLSAKHFASLMVGRWPSGAPVMRAPEEDDAVLAGDEFANNHFLFNDDTRASALIPMDGYLGDNHRAAAADVFATLCPHAAHIRKVNPRDSGTDLGTPADTLLRLMLRRGIPYGERIAGVENPSPELVAEERGLMFAAYMSSIEDQFELVSRRWANSAVQPNLGGFDPIIGQRDSRGDRMRTMQIRRPGGVVAEIPLPVDWVQPTGGGYFFTPPISALTQF